MDVTVVISSDRRPAQLARCLQALAAQTLPVGAFEVVVVNNGAGMATRAVLDRADADLDMCLRIVEHPRTRGPAGGRNSGWRIARAAHIAFTDDDCQPTPTWLEQLLRVAATAPAGAIVQGATGPPPSQHRPGIFAHVVAVNAADGRYETCNILYPRELLERLGGFDERFIPRGMGRLPVGEDTDLGWRARRLGVPVLFAPDALVHHDVVLQTPIAAMAHVTRWAGAVHLFAVHPEAREILFRRVFWNVWHYMLIQALLTLFGPRWLRRLVLGRYLRALADRAQEAGSPPWVAPGLVILDATEMAALLRASLTEGTLVL